MTFDLDDATIWWTILGVVIVLAIVALVFLARAGIEARRLKARTDAYKSSPIIATIAKGEVDVQRLQTSVAQLTELLARAEAALRVLRVRRIARGAGRLARPRRIVVGGEGGTRTHMSSHSVAFEATASTISPLPRIRATVAGSR